MNEPICKWNVDQLRSALHQLFEDAGYVNAELEQYFEAAVKGMAELDLLKKQSLKVIPSKSYAADRMSSKLRDALRE